MIGITKQLNQFKSFLYLKPQYIAHNIKFYLKICATNICKHQFLKSYSINNTIITKTKKQKRNRQPYLQSRNRDTDIENRNMDTKPERLWWDELGDWD